MDQPPAPVVFGASNEWLGNDGNWSTFILRVGEPPQNFHVLPASATGEMIVPHIQGCTVNATVPADCGARRGVLSIDGQPSPGFQYSRSTTWKKISRYSLDLENRLEIEEVRAEYGYDQVGLMLSNSGGPTLSQRVVATVAKKVFFLGLFGLNPQAVNFTNYENPIPSYMTTLKDKNLIPSLSYGYTAGAYYSK